MVDVNVDVVFVDVVVVVVTIHVVANRIMFSGSQ